MRPPLKQVVQELKVEDRWANTDDRQLRKMVAAVMTQGSKFESTQAWRSSQQKRTVYRLQGGGA